MPSPAEHERWAQHNENFARWLNGKWPHWIVTAVFYAALHYVDAFLRGDCGWNPTRDEEKHSVRNDLLLNWRDLRRPYMRLYQYAHDARYRPAAEPPVDRAFQALEQVKDEIERLRAGGKTGG